MKGFNMPATCILYDAHHRYLQASSGFEWPPNRCGGSNNIAMASRRRTYSSVSEKMDHVWRWWAAPASRPRPTVRKHVCRRSLGSRVNDERH